MRFIQCPKKDCQHCIECLAIIIPWLDSIHFAGNICIWCVLYMCVCYIARTLQQLHPTCTDIIIQYTLLRDKGGQVCEDVKDLNVHLVFTVVLLQTYMGADKSLARPTSQCILFDG